MVAREASAIPAIIFALQILPLGKRRSALIENFEKVLVDKIEWRVAPFDAAAAQQSGDLMAMRYKRGRPGALRDSESRGS